MSEIYARTIAQYTCKYTLAPKNVCFGERHKIDNVIVEVKTSFG